MIAILRGAVFIVAKIVEMIHNPEDLFPLFVLGALGLLWFGVVGLVALEQGYISDAGYLVPTAILGLLALAETIDGTAATSGKKPQGLAASCVYVAADEARESSKRSRNGEGITQDQLGAAAGVTPVTIRNNLPIVREVAEDA